MHLRIIPARAGFTSMRSNRIITPGDHPRSRGVYGYFGYEIRPAAGSSPLARGLPVGEPAGRAKRRIIPARAGFTASACARTSPSRDHPRSRGVYEIAFQMDETVSGSSPLARGLLEVGAASVAGRGIIPARAGFTPR